MVIIHRFQMDLNINTASPNKHFRIYLLLVLGLPLGMIGVAIIADNEIFDGYFTDCIFR